MYQLVIVINHEVYQEEIIKRSDTLTEEMKNYCDYFRNRREYGTDNVFVEIRKINDEFGSYDIVY